MGSMAPTDTTVLTADNPFADVSSLPCGLPDFPAIRTEHFAEAITAGIARQRAEWEAIATDSAPAAVENTLDALERSGALLDRVLAVFHLYVGARADDELRAVEAEFSATLAEHHDALYLDRRIAARLDSIDVAQLDAEAAWLLREYRTSFRRAGVHLEDATQDRLRRISARLSELETEFSQRVVKSLDAGAVQVDDRERLDGLDEGTVDSLGRAAADRGSQGWLITLQLPTQQALGERLTDRDLREELHRASVSRGAGVDAASDTRPILLEIATLRAERASLLGYPHHAAYVAEDNTARTAEAVAERLAQLAPPAVANAHAEAAELEELAAEELKPWDWSYWAERARRERFAVDSEQVRQYLELDRVIHDGVFFAATELYGITFTERHDLPGYAEDVRVWQVDDADGEMLGLFVGDYYTREGKQGGAWMQNLVDQSRLLGTRPVVVNNLNIVPPPEGRPTLLTWDEVITAFHEFGHALHGLFSDVNYPSLSGANVPRDFVEFPSQVNEMWATHPRVLANYARHHATGEPLPARRRESLVAAADSGQGFATTEYLAAALLDQAWHRIEAADVPTDPEDVAGFELSALRQAGIDLPLVPPRYRSTYFNHVFGGGYAAGYYSYIWSEVLDADTVEWFRETGQDGGLDRAAGERFRRELLSRGHSTDPLRAYATFRGAEPRIEPLLQRRGLVATESESGDDR